MRRLSEPGRKGHFGGTESGIEHENSQLSLLDGVVPVEPRLKICGSDEIIAEARAAHVTTRCAY